MLPRRVTILAIALVGACMAACVSILDLDDARYEAIADAAIPDDSGTLQPDADAGASDAPSVSDVSAGPDVGQVDAEASVPFSCVAQPSAWTCDDFERTTPLASTPFWTQVNSLGGMSVFEIVIDPSSPSGSRSALATVIPAEARQVILDKALSTGGLRCELDMKLAPTSQGEATIFELEVSNGSGGAYRITLVTNGANLDVKETGSSGGATGYTPATRSLTMPTGWNHFVVKLAVGVAPQLFVSAGASSVSTPQNDLSVIAAPTAAKLTIGALVNASPGMPWKVQYDNVVCTTLP